MITQAELKQIYKKSGGFWKHDGKPETPHILLKSGLHSDGYINSRLPLSDGKVCRRMAKEMVAKLRTKYKGRVDYVLSASYGGNDLGAHAAELLGASHVYTEKDGDEQVWRSFQIPPGKKVLAIEELVTKGTSARRMLTAVKKSNESEIDFIPYFLTLVSRSDLKEIDGLKLISVVRIKLLDVESDKCPLCKIGSIALPPKKNWQLFK